MEYTSKALILLITETSTTELYTSLNSGRDSLRYPQQQRETHGKLNYNFVFIDDF